MISINTRMAGVASDTDPCPSGSLKYSDQPLMKEGSAKNQMTTRRRKYRATQASLKLKGPSSSYSDFRNLLTVLLFSLSSSFLSPQEARSRSQQ